VSRGKCFSCCTVFKIAVVIEIVTYTAVEEKFYAAIFELQI